MRTGEAASCTARAARRTIAVAVTLRHRRPRAGNREVVASRPDRGHHACHGHRAGWRRGRCYVSALSEHPDSAQAAAEVTAQVLEQLGAVPELAVFFVTPPHRDAVGDIADVVRSVLQPVTLLGAAAVAVLGPRREVEETPAVVAVRRPTWLTGGPRPPPRRADRRRLADQRIPDRCRRRPVAAPGRRSVHVSCRRPAGRAREDAAGPGGRGRHGVGGQRTGGQPAARRRLVLHPTGRSGRCSPRTSPRKPSCHRAAGRSGAPTSSPAPTAT